MGIRVQVPGTSTYDWVFKQSDIAPSLIDIEKQDTTRPDLEPDHYHQVRAGIDRGGKAIQCLIERFDRLEKFFQAARKLSMTTMHSDRFDGFIDKDLCDEDELEEAWELVGTMIEEANQAEA